MGYGSRAMELLQKYYEGKIQSLSEGEDTEISNVEDGVGTCLSQLLNHYMSLVVRKLVFGVYNHVRHKPGCAITEEG